MTTVRHPSMKDLYRPVLRTRTRTSVVPHKFVQIQRSHPMAAKLTLSPHILYHGTCLKQMHEHKRRQGFGASSPLSRPPTVTWRE